MSENKIAIKKPSDVLAGDTFDPAALQDWHKDVETEQKGLMRVALFVLIFVIGFGGVWSCTAKIGGAVIASGRVVAEGRNRVVQHLEGGIVDQIEVREGDVVRKGQVLARLDGTQIESQVRNLEIQEAIYRIQLARRRAEVTGADSIDFPDDIKPEVLSQRRVQDTLENQRTEFDALRAVGIAEVENLQSGIKAERLNLEINAATGVALVKQLELNKEQLAGQYELDEKGFARDDRIKQLEREKISLESEIENGGTERLRVQENIASFENQIKQVNLNYVRDAAAQIVNIQLQLNETSETLARLYDVETRGTIVSPVDGKVFRVATTTLGAVLRPGDTLFEIFPEGEGLRLEATVQIQDIEQVSVGQEATIVFASNKGQAEKPLYGEVTYISDDAVSSEDTPPYFVAHINIKDQESADQPILPGNVGEVYLKTTPKTLMQYITEPITRFAGRVFTG
jgi:HlyD family type I secretion membrane fusion protein